MPEENAPEQQVFQRRLVGALVAAQEADQHVGRKRHQLQAHEQQHQVEAAGHAHHAYNGEQDQGVELAVRFAFHLQVAHRHQHRHRRPHQEQVEKVNGKAVHQHAAEEAGMIGYPLRLERPLNFDYAGSREPQAGQGDHGIETLPLRRQNQIDQQDSQGEQREQHDGKRQQIIAAGEVL